MSSRSRRDFLELSSGRTLRRSETYYDVREPSYYGPDFQNVERELSSSFSSPRRIPVMEEPHRKRPDPYSSDVIRDYNYYKARGGAANAAGAEFYADKDVASEGRPSKEKAERLRKSKELGYNARRLANETAQSRSGFIHKYPHAYSNFDDTGHQEAVNTRLNQARRIRREESKIERRIQICDALSRGEKPRGIPKNEYRSGLF